MASYNLNEILKKMQSPKNDGEKEMELGDTARVKVLSPGRQVFKRFIRNRLAIFGAIVLVCMFLFAFVGPLFYTYEQDEVSRKFEAMEVRYALAQQRTSYMDYDVDTSVEYSRSAANMMNTYIGQMEAQGITEMLALGSDGAYYHIAKTADGIYTFSKVNATAVAQFGDAQINVGTLSVLDRAMTYADSANLGDAFVEAAIAACRGASGSFEFEGTTYEFVTGSGRKTYDITASSGGGFQYSGAALDAGFEAAATSHAESALNVAFDYNGASYVVSSPSEGAFAAYRIDGEPMIAKVFTLYAFDGYETGYEAPNDFRVAALLAADISNQFEFEGETYTIERNDDVYIVSNSAGEPFVEMSSFVVRRYNGDNTMELGLKDAIREAVIEMNNAGQSSTEITYRIPQQEEDGTLSYDDDGNLLYAEDTEIQISMTRDNEYTVVCDQITYLIDMYAPPSSAHLLGTDGDGFDVLARIMYGGRISLIVGFIVVILETLLGVIMGGIAGYFGKWVDNLIMRLVDIFYCLPTMPIMIILGAMMDAMRWGTYLRLMVMMAALGIMGWASIARLVRGQILSLREQEFMTAAEATGLPVGRRIFRHLIPNVMPQLIVSATMGLGSVILTESTLSFLGLGVKHPLATWGTMINSVSSATAMVQYTYIWIPVGLLICLTVIAFNFIGDGLRDAFDPKGKR